MYLQLLTDLYLRDSCWNIIEVESKTISHSQWLEAYMAFVWVLCMVARRSLLIVSSQRVSLDWWYAEPRAQI